MARGPARTIEGRRECQNFLNSTVKSLEDELCSNLRFFDRRSLLEAALRTHEAAAVDRDRWRITAKANLALRKDKSDVLKTIAERQSRLNGVSVAARILIEAGLCECSDGGAVPGALDLSRLMTTASSLFHLGGWSSAIRWGAMEPRLKISALGDVMAATDFEDGVLRQFGQAISNMEVARAEGKYPDQYEPITPAPVIGDIFDPAFTAAWYAEFGATVDEVRAFIDTLENEGLRRSAAVYWLKLTELSDIAKKEGVLAPSRAEHVAARFVFGQRREWRSLPDGFEQKDRWPWRFRRRLSLMRYPLPLCDLSSTGEAELLVAPGMVRENFAYLVSNLFDGGFSDDYVSSPAMRSWIGAANDRSGHTFNEEVAARVRQLGWETRIEVKLTEILRRSLDRDYGDVDVLAWRASDGRVLVIECKDMRFSKTPGEVAEQLADFRGEFDERGKPDLLRKHLNRVDILRENTDSVSKFLRTPKVIRIEAHLVFRNTVPMSFAWDRLAGLSKIWVFDEIDNL